MAENFLDSVDIAGVAPQLTLTDTDPGAKSLRIDVNNNIAQIREKAGGENSLLSFDLAKNQITAFDTTDWSSTALFMIAKKDILTQDPSFSCFVLARLKQDRPAPPPGGQSVYTALACGTDVFTQTLTAADKIVGLEASCAAAQGSATFGNAIRAYCTATGNPPNTQITHSHVINIPPSNVPDAPPPNPPTPKVNTIPNSIALRIAKQFEVSPPRTRNYGIYYGSHAEGSEPAGTFAIYADEDDCFFRGSVGIGRVPVSGGDKLTVLKVGQNLSYAIGLYEGNHRIGINPNSPTGAGLFNPLIQAGDKTIIFSDGLLDTENLVIGPISLANNSGIRMTNTGLIGVGTANPAASLHIKAGTATVAPLKLTAGTNLTTPQAGAFEYDGTNLYFTKGDGVRRVIQMV